MTVIKAIATGLIGATAMVAAIGHATANTIGVAVSAVGGSPVGLPTLDLLGGPGAIKYYIPLGDSNGGIYGTTGLGNPCGSTGFGTCADYGNGGAVLAMVLEFSPVSITDPSFLSVNFQDLDLTGGNDPDGFRESLNIYKWNGASFVSILPGGSAITSLGGLITGDHDFQSLTLALGTLTADPLYLKFKFQADSDFYGKNTAEYLRATVYSVPGPIVGAGLPGLIAALGLLSLARRRRRKLSACIS